MTAAEFATHVRYKTRTTSTTFTNPQILALMKVRQLEIAQDIMKVDEDILLIPQTDDLVASTITAREYPMPSDILSRFKRVEAKLNGTDWVVLYEIDINEIGVPVATETEITNVFNNSQLSKSNLNGARFDIIRKSLFIFSGTITATTDGLKLWVNTWPAAITNLTATDEMNIDPSTTTHGIPRAMHEIWSRGVIIDYKESREKPIPLTQRELKYERDKRTAIQTLRHGYLDREIFGALPPASERGNDGADY